MPNIDAVHAAWRAIYNSPDIDEWWGTDEPNEFVFVGTHHNDCDAFRVRIEPVPLPPFGPAEWEEGGLAHPFGWRERGPKVPGGERL